MHQALPRPGGSEPSFVPRHGRRGGLLGQIRTTLQRLLGSTGISGHKSSASASSSLRNLLLALLALFTLYTFVSLVTTPEGYNYKTGIPVIGGGPDSVHVAFSRQPYIYPNIANEDLKDKDGASRDRQAVTQYTQVVYRDGGKAKPVTQANIVKGHAPFVRSAPHKPRTVIVMGLDGTDAARADSELSLTILQNRLEYAKMHDFGLYARLTQDFLNPLSGHGISPENYENWAKLEIIRAAMQAFPDADRIWWLDSNAVISNFDFNIETQLCDPVMLDKIMLRDVAVIPPNGIIHSYKRVPARDVQFLVTQDDAGLTSASMVISNDQYGQVLMDYWRDPLQYKYEDFRKQQPGNPENAALTHMAQWHPTVLSKAAIIPARILAARAFDGEVLKDVQYAPGDFVRLVPCHSAYQCPSQWLEALLESHPKGVKGAAKIV